ncbi:MAG TPA: head maturation protease, ClpP-related, partial [Segetibacter sp.]
MSNNVTTTKKKFWTVNKVNTKTAEMLIYGFIGQYEEIDDAEFIKDLRQLEAAYADINFRINCGGGDVYKGLAIYNSIRNSKCNTTSYVDGIAASMGAVIAASTNKTYMSKYARFMTHRVTGFCGGNSDDLRNFAIEFDNYELSIAEILANKTGLTKEAAKTKYITNKDRWISAE